MSTQLNSFPYSVPAAKQNPWQAPRSTGDDNSLRMLEGMGTKMRYGRGETVFGEGDAASFVYRIVSGGVRLCRHLSDGRRQIVDFRLPGDFIGLMARSEYTLTAETLADTVLVAYQRRQLDLLCDNHVGLRREMMSVLTEKLASMQDHMVMLGRQTAHERMAAFLLMLAGRVDADDGDAIALPMSRQDMADYMGLTIETVCRMLSQMKRERVIGMLELHRLTLTNIEKLRSSLEEDADELPRARISLSH